MIQADDYLEDDAKGFVFIFILILCSIILYSFYKET